MEVLTMKMSTKKITTIGMLCSMAVVINLMVHFPLVPAVSFLSYDPKDIVIVIGGFIDGPFASLIMSVITSLLEVMFRGGTILDILMNVISTCTFAATASYVYRRNHTKKDAMIGLILGTLACTVSMLLWNYIVTPVYFQMPREAVVALLVPGILPFNLLKCGINAAVTIFLYQPVVTILRRSNLLEKDNNDQKKTFDMLVLGLFILISLILVILSFQGII